MIGIAVLDDIVMVGVVATPAVLASVGVAIVHVTDVVCSVVDIVGVGGGVVGTVGSTNQYIKRAYMTVISCILYIYILSIMA